MPHKCNNAIPFHARSTSRSTSYSILKMKTTYSAVIQLRLSTPSSKRDSLDVELT